MAKRKKTSRIIIARETWPEAEIIAEPERERDGEPRVLVRRRFSGIVGPNGEDLFCVRGAGTHISLFAGCGGMDLGCEMAGFMTVCQHEWDQTACQTLLANRPRCFRHSALIQGDIRSTPTEMMLAESGLRVGEADLVTGGPPCQGFSTAGKRQVDDVRNTLVYDYLRVIRQAQPKFFVMENVPGFVSLGKGQFFRSFLEAAYHECYYELVYGLVNAVESGVPQDRCRFICMGTRRDIAAIEGALAALPRPTHFSPHDNKEVTYLERRPLLVAELDRLTRPPGIRYFPDRPILTPPRPIKMNHKNGTSGRSKSFLAFFDRLEREEPDRIVNVPIDARDVDERQKDNWLAGRWSTVRDAIGDLEGIELATSER